MMKNKTLVVLLMSLLIFGCGQAQETTQEQDVQLQNDGQLTQITKSSQQSTNQESQTSNDRQNKINLVTNAVIKSEILPFASPALQETIEKANQIIDKTGEYGCEFIERFYVGDDFQDGVRIAENIQVKFINDYKVQVTYDQRLQDIEDSDVKKTIVDMELSCGVNGCYIEDSNNIKSDAQKIIDNGGCF